MPDREKVIENMNIAKAVLCNPNMVTPEMRIKIGQTISDAISLLKEQEWQTKRLTPTEPNVSINAYGVKFYYCPHCQRPILKSGIIGRPRHCEDCGQAVKWND